VAQINALGSRVVAFDKIRCSAEQGHLDILFGKKLGLLPVGLTVYHRVKATVN
jgi:hypothetical protein